MAAIRTVWEEKAGRARLRIVEQAGRLTGLVIGGRGEGVLARFEGEDAESLRRHLREKAGIAGAGYVGFDGARKRFLGHFPDGFRDPRYLDHERTYKLKARDKLLSLLPLEEALDAENSGERALRAFRTTNLLSPFEQMRVQDVLRSEHADAFVRAAARFAQGSIGEAIAAMAAVMKPHDAFKWTAVTYLPFLWRPDEHLFLKPSVTQDFAERVGHPFAREYEATPNEATYRSLLGMNAATARAIADIAPRDGIDVQSFIWVVGYYPDPEDADATGPD